MKSPKITESEAIVAKSKGLLYLYQQVDDRDFADETAELMQLSRLYLAVSIEYALQAIEKKYEEAK